MASLIEFTKNTKRLFSPEQSGRNEIKQEIFETVLKFGRASTNFLTLYSGYQYLEQRGDGLLNVLAYVDTFKALVAAGDPVSNHPMDMIRALQTKAQEEGKSWIAIPVCKELAREARMAGFCCIQIGTEPWFDLNAISFSLSLEKNPNARKFVAKGAFVEALDLVNISTRDRQDLDILIHSWLSSRPSVPLGFLNRLEPMTKMNFKRFFRAIHHHRTVGFLGAVPIEGGKAWYLVDLIRRPDAPIGTIEALILTAMNQLKQGGAKEVSLGLSPLADLGNGQEASYFPRLYPWLTRIFETSRFFYGFCKKASLF